MQILLAIATIALLCEAAKCPPKNWITQTPKISRNTNMGTVHVPPNFALDFDITPETAINGWGSIIHYTQDDKDNATPGSRIPGIWFTPGDTKLYIRFGGETFRDQGITTRSLPLGQRTSVRVEARGPSVSAFLNGSLAGYFHAPSRRFSGPATFYVGDPWYESADAVVKNIQLSSTDMLSFQSLDSIVPMDGPNGTLLIPKLHGKVVVPADYSLSFAITPTGVLSDWQSILHYTKDGNNIGTAGSRMPGIWFAPGSSKLHVYMDGLNFMNRGLETRALAINQTTLVVLEAYGNQVSVTLNGIFSGFMETPSTRITGEAFSFISDPWYPSALATISNIQLKALTHDPFLSQAMQSEFQLAPRNYGKVTVPKDYSLSFDIVPKGLVSGWSSILHYTKDGRDIGSPGSRMPALFFHGSTTRLHLRLDGETFQNLGIDSNNLPMDAKTRVEIEALGNQVMLYFNGTFAGSVVTPSPRLSGEAYLFASDLWYPPANAVISNYELKEIDQSRLTVPSAEWSTEVKLTSRNFGKVTLPENFELSFDITPLGLVQGWASIIHFSKDGQDANRGSRIPGIWFQPNGFGLHCRADGETFTNAGVNTRPIPINTKTNVVIELIDKEMIVYLNGTLAGFFVFPSARITGEAFMFVSDPFYASANALIANIKINQLTESRREKMVPQLSTEFRLSSQYFGKMRVPADYSLSFDITPLGLINDWGTIIHFSMDGQDIATKGSRMPGIWFGPQSTRLHIRTDGETFQNVGVDPTLNLPLNVKTTVVVECIGDRMLVSLNGNLAGFRILPSPRISGEAHLFVGDPFYPAANAMLSNFKLTDLAASPSLLTAPLTKLANTVLRPEYYGKVTVPVNYSLRFNIRPTQVIPTWGSIIHYSIDGADMGSRGSRMPAIFTHPGSLNLHVRVDGNTYLNAGIDTTVQLPLNAMTAVRLEAVGQSLQLFYNNTMVGSVQLASPRISGEAHLFASDFFYEPTRGTIQSLELVAK